MNIEEKIVGIIPLLITSITLLYTIKKYKRDKRQDLENQLFKMKLEAYQNITFELDRTLMYMYNAFTKLQSTHEVDLHKLANEIDERLYESHSNIVKNSVIFSDGLTLEINHFVLNILNSEDYNENEPWGYYEDMLQKANSIDTNLREELMLRPLHESLYQRYQSRK